MNKYHIQIGQLFVCIAKYMHMHFRCLFYNMKILYTKSKVSEHSSWSRAARQPAKSRMRLASRRFATPALGTPGLGYVSMVCGETALQV